MRSTQALDRILQREQALAVTLLTRAWRKVTPTQDFGLAWRRQQQALVPALEAVQYRTATLASLAPPAELAEQGVYVAPAAPINPSGYVGTNGDGRALSEALDVLPVRARTVMASGRSAAEGLRSAQALGTVMVQTMLADLVRMVSSTSIAARPRTMWVRHVTPPCCDRCAILAGKVFRYNEGFLRHPGCDCYHVATVNADGLAGQQVTDPYEYFTSLTEAEQNRYFGKANAEAIRDGADIYQVVNSRRGMTKTGMFTTEGTTRRGAWGRTAAGQIDGRRRMTPQAIYDLAHSRDEAIEMLTDFGYLLPSGQVPGGSIRGIAFDPRTTMTAAQRRVLDANWQLSEVAAGRNPFTTAATERRWNLPRSSATDSPLTPRLAASVEQHATLMLAANGELTTYRQYVRLGQGLILPTP